MIRHMSRVLANDMIFLETPVAVGRWLVWLDTGAEYAATVALWKAAQAGARVDELLDRRAAR